MANKKGTKDKPDFTQAAQRRLEAMRLANKNGGAKTVKKAGRPNYAALAKKPVERWDNLSAPSKRKLERRLGLGSNKFGTAGKTIKT